MALTAKPISTISYNSEGFLQAKLEQLKKAKIIERYMYIKHTGEDGDKDHIHLYMEPTKRLQTSDLVDNFKEIDPNNDKPLGVLNFRTSDPFNWIMYVIHDKDYLRNHHSDEEGNKIEYSINEIVTDIQEQLERDYRRAQSLRKTESQRVIEALERGQNPLELIYSDNVKPSTVIQIISLNRLITQENNINKAMKERMQMLLEENAKAQHNIEVLNSEFMRRDLEEKTGEKIERNIDKKVKWFDE